MMGKKLSKKHAPGHLANMLALGIVLAYKEGHCPIPLSWDIPDEYIIGTPTNMLIRFAKGQQIEFTLMVTNHKKWLVVGDVTIRNADTAELIKVITQADAQKILDWPEGESGGPTP